MAPSVCSQNSFPPPQPTSATCALAELAALTVRLFPPKAIASIRHTFASNPHLGLAEHLPILGNLIVRHVALCLCDDQPLTKSSVSEKSKSTPSNRRIPPYRSLAYAAVRSNRIIPESTPLSPVNSTPPDSPATTVSTRPPARRLSITVPKRPVDAVRRVVSQPQLPLRERQAESVNGSDGDEVQMVEKVDVESLHMQNANQVVNVSEIVNVSEESGVKRTATPVGAVRRQRCLEPQNRDEVFPRAKASAAIELESCRQLRLEGEKSATSNSRMAGTGSKLVQLRRQRSERRARGVR